MFPPLPPRPIPTPTELQACPPSRFEQRNPRMVRHGQAHVDYDIVVRVWREQGCPPAWQLAEQFAVSPQTIRRALRDRR